MRQLILFTCFLYLYSKIDYSVNFIITQIYVNSYYDKKLILVFFFFEARDDIDYELYKAGCCGIEINLKMYSIPRIWRQWLFDPWNHNAHTRREGGMCTIVIVQYNSFPKTVNIWPLKSYCTHTEGGRKGGMCTIVGTTRPP